MNTLRRDSAHTALVCWRRCSGAVPLPGVTFVRCGERSVLSNEARRQCAHLCVVLRDPARGFVVDNAALVTWRECIALSMAQNDTISTRLMDCTE